MNIGIDIDGVLTNDDEYMVSTLDSFIYENHLEDHKNFNAYEYNKVNWDQSHLSKYVDQYFWNYGKKEPARKYASEVIKKLKEDGNKIYIITSRRYTTENTKNGKKERAIVKKWLKKQKIFYDQLYFSKDKVEEINKLKIDIMVEDSPETIPIFVKHTHVLCFDCRYNKHLNLDNMTRVFSWYDIYMKISKKKEGTE